jgi:hypothetical protein
MRGLYYVNAKTLKMNPILSKFAYCIFMFYFLGISPKIFSQKKDSIIFNLSDLTPMLISLPPVDTVRVLPVNGISVADRRYDGSTTGFYKSSYLLLGNNAADEVKKYLQASFRFAGNNKTPDSLIVVIKKLWVTNELKLLPRVVIERKKHISFWQPGLMCKMECFYKQQDVYFPLFRLDTTLGVEKDIVENAPALIATCLKRLNEKIAHACASLNLSGTKMNATQVEDYYASRFDMQVLKETAYTKGLYKTFADFKNDKPFCSKFEVKSSTLADVIYMTDSTGSEYPARDIWGYSDGDKLYIKLADNYFVLVRRSNSFYVRGFKDVEDWVLDMLGRPVSINGYPIPSGAGRAFTHVHKVFYKYYQLDMENGQMF